MQPGLQDLQASTKSNCRSRVTDGVPPCNSYERKLKLIMDHTLAHYHGSYTPEQYALELKVAIGYLAVLGVVS